MAVVIFPSTHLSKGIDILWKVSISPSFDVCLSRRKAMHLMLVFPSNSIRKLLELKILECCYKTLEDTHKTHPSHLPTHLFKSRNHIPPTSSVISRPSSHILVRRKRPTSSEMSCVNCGIDEMVSVACDRCAVSVDGDKNENRIECLYNHIKEMGTKGGNPDLLSILSMHWPPTDLTC